MAVPSATAPKRNMAKVNSTATASIFNRSDVIPVVVPRNNVRLEQTSESRKEGLAGRTMPLSLPSKTSDLRKFSNIRDDLESPIASVHSQAEGFKSTELSGVADRNIFPAAKSSNIGIPAAERNAKDDKCIVSGELDMNLMTEPVASYQHESSETRMHKANRDACSMEGQKGGRTCSLGVNWEKRERSPYYKGPASSNFSRTVSAVNTLPANASRCSLSVEKETVSASDEDAIADVMEQHDQFIGSMQSRLAKLQIVHKYWQRNDVKGAISVLEKMADHAVLADVISFFTKKNDIVTLDICTCLLPLLTTLLESDMDRHQGISLEMLLKLVRVFGSVIYSSLSASSSVGVDIEAEQRLERCNLCFIELEKVKRCLPVLTRRGGSVAKFAQELNLALQEVS
uniref:Katanin p80 subunit C-terminal domain-containing protein n=1 Tax=Davidia involucrata TaxID=16924 RepID=A0A5B6ZJG2_DAVIN